MGYPNYPKNRLLVGGVDLSEKFKMVLVDGYSLKPPEPKTYTVDIPGGNGKLDLTESLIGYPAYDNRKQEFTFYIIDDKNFERTKTEVSNFLHGKVFDYKFTMDPEYIYHGRFSISSYTHESYANGIAGIIKITIDADPFKFKSEQVFRVDAVGGTIVYFNSGKMRVRPTIETDGFLRVIYDNKLVILRQGAWTINDLLFTEGINKLYFNSYDIRNLTWGDLKTNGVTWGNFKAKRIYEWYKANGNGNQVNKIWSDLSENTWADLADQTWASQMFKFEIVSTIKNIYVKYDWGDL